MLSFAKKLLLSVWDYMIQSRSTKKVATYICNVKELRSDKRFELLLHCVLSVSTFGSAGTHDHILKTSYNVVVRITEAIISDYYYKTREKTVANSALSALFFFFFGEWEREWERERSWVYTFRLILPLLQEAICQRFRTPIGKHEGRCRKLRSRSWPLSLGRVVETFCCKNGVNWFRLKLVWRNFNLFS